MSRKCNVIDSVVVSSHEPLGHHLSHPNQVRGPPAIGEISRVPSTLYRPPAQRRSKYRIPSPLMASGELLTLNLTPPSGHPQLARNAPRNHRRLDLLLTSSLLCSLPGLFFSSRSLPLLHLPLRLTSCAVACNIFLRFPPVSPS